MPPACTELGFSSRGRANLESDVIKSVIVGTYHLDLVLLQLRYALQGSLFTEDDLRSG